MERLSPLLRRANQKRADSRAKWIADPARKGSARMVALADAPGNHPKLPVWAVFDCPPEILADVEICPPSGSMIVTSSICASMKSLLPEYKIGADGSLVVPDVQVRFNVPEEIRGMPRFLRIAREVYRR